MADVSEFAGPLREAHRQALSHRRDDVAGALGDADLGVQLVERRAHVHRAVQALLHCAAARA